MTKLKSQGGYVIPVATVLHAERSGSVPPWQWFDVWQLPWNWNIALPPVTITAYDRKGNITNVRKHDRNHGSNGVAKIG